jgi:hypothetical protein
VYDDGRAVGANRQFEAEVILRILKNRTLRESDVMDPSHRAEIVEKIFGNLAGQSDPGVTSQ